MFETSGCIPWFYGLWYLLFEYEDSIPSLLSRLTTFFIVYLIVFEYLIF